MQLLINNKYQEVEFWSFAKCVFLSNIAIAGIFYGALLILGLFLIAFGGVN